MLPQDERDLRGALKAEAQRHRPDRAAMLERIERGRARSSTAARLAAWFRPVGFLRPIAAAAGVVAILVAGVTGIRVAGRPSGPAAPAAESSAETSAPPTPPASPSARSGVDGSGGHGAPPRSVTSTAPAESTTRPTVKPSTSATPVVVRDGYLSATAALDAGSIGTWSQSDVLVTTNKPITALVVEIHIARTDGVAKTGHWSSISDDQTTSEVDTSDATLIYRFTVKPGNTLAPGTYTFAAQFSHAEGARPLAGDTYTVTTIASDSDHATVTGGF
ncbi:hypothetical protein [Actinoplanes subtropicus]|uniref:hypothetical protein n=1 Tax=Actinoplanes subtropicus TaxID=543632 RepID=UPI0004C3FDF6|nr:hypothetical protein [Actinoplanes subtropicus]